MERGLEGSKWGRGGILPNFDDDDVVVLRPSVWKWIIVGLTCASFLTITFVLHRKFSDVEFLLSLVFWDIGLGVAVLAWIPAWNFLRIDREGFEVSRIGFSKHILWRDVHSFGIMSSDPPMVGYNWIAERPLSARKRSSIRLTGFAECLPDTYRCDAELLADWLNGHRMRFAGATHLAPPNT